MSKINASKLIDLTIKAHSHLAQQKDIRIEYEDRITKYQCSNALNICKTASSSRRAEITIDKKS